MDIIISELNNMDDGTLANVWGKVTKVTTRRNVSTSIHVVQEVTLQDETGITTLSLWNKIDDRLSESATYNFTMVTVNTV